MMMMDELDEEGVRKPFSTLNLDEEEEEEEGETLGMLPSVPTKKHNKKASQRRRRRSSARFLHLGASDDNNEDEKDEPVPETEQLGELYKRAIRMNAENRINAGNSWNIKLIENMDKVLEQNEESNQEGVNFTKASCTLDASVKIYSYRVDDVHLSSYKVLANLNRNDSQKNTTAGSNNANATQGEDGILNDDGEECDEDGPSQRRAGASVETLETNLANINISKLDAAYDIDPLFHKMSKAFDEVGAKGLLLVNLGVGNQGCNIVFDSAQQQDGHDDAPADDAADLEADEAAVDITSLSTKLADLLGDTTLESLQLVPQLQTLRQEYAVLEQEGFIAHENIKRSRRYATSQEEEKEAEISIHQEALERSIMSRKSQATGSGGDVAATDSPLVSPQAPHDDHAAEYAADDWGADDDDDVGFTDFIQNDDNGKRYSSISFQNESFFESQQEQTGALLDALYAEIGSQNDYQYFSQQSLDRLAGNQWAGSLHWKTSSWQKKKTSATVDDKKTKATTTTRKKKRSFVDFTLPSSSDFLQKPAKPSSIVLSTAIQTKYGKADNLLPLDAGMTVQELTKLFLRPSAVIKPATTNSSKTVGFHAENDVIFDDGSLGGDDDGPGFAFAGDDDDFVVQDFDDVRKVDKIQVGYATVAKKVDVKRLKKDLWSELETNFELEEENYSEKENNKPVLSFKDTVSEMETHKSQSDVTLPFYFICLLHLANEKGLRLESQGLGDFLIVQEDI